MATLSPNSLPLGNGEYVLDEAPSKIYNAGKIDKGARGIRSMENLSKELNQEVNIFFGKYKDLNDDIASKRLGSDTWSPKEIVGHLIDSASNNHQRFVRLQIVDELVFPGYGQDNSKWLQIQRYNEMTFSDIMLLWKQYNILIANIIKKVDESKLENRWKNSEGDKKTLRDLMIDYLRHLKDHLQHFEHTLEELQR
jgi:hypothetical protein